MYEDGGVCTSTVPQLQGVHRTHVCDASVDTRHDVTRTPHVNRPSEAAARYAALSGTVRRHPVHLDATTTTVMTSNEYRSTSEPCTLHHGLPTESTTLLGTRSDDDDSAKGTVLCAPCSAILALAHRATPHKPRPSPYDNRHAHESAVSAPSLTGDEAAEQVLAELRVEELWAGVETGAMEVFRLTRRRDLARAPRCRDETASQAQHSATQLTQSEEDLRSYSVLYHSCVDAFVRACNLAALRFLNDHRYSFALQVLLRAQEVVRPGAGRRFRYICSAREEARYIGNTTAKGANTESDAEGVDVTAADGATYDRQGDERAPCHVTPSSGQSEVGDGWGQVYVAYYDTAHEVARRRATAVVDNNFGLYHFELGEYDLACDRLARAAVQEECLGVDSLGITYYNLAQAQYRLDRSAPEIAMHWMRLAAAAVERRVQDGAAALEARRTAVRLRDGDNDDGVVGARTAAMPFTALWLKWRDAVCLLVRVKWQLGVWLQRVGQYQAALRCYEESLRWLSGAGTLSGDELDRVTRLTRRMQDCRRAMRAQRAASHARRVATPGPINKLAPVSPRREIVTPARVVTTLLPRHVEVIDTAVPASDTCPNVPSSYARRSHLGLPPRPPEQRRRKEGRAPWRGASHLSYAAPSAVPRTTLQTTPPLARRQEKQQQASVARRRSSLRSVATTTTTNSVTPHRSYLSSFQASSMVQCITLVQAFLRAKSSLNVAQYASRQTVSSLRREVKSAGTNSSSRPATRYGYTSPNLTSFTRAMPLSRNGSSDSSRHGTDPVVVMPLTDVCARALCRADDDWRKGGMTDPSFLQPVTGNSVAYSAAGVSDFLAMPRTYLPI